LPCSHFLTAVGNRRRLLLAVAGTLLTVRLHDLLELGSGFRGGIERLLWEKKRRKKDNQK